MPKMQTSFTGLVSQLVRKLYPEFRSWPERSCDASSQKGAGVALAAGCKGSYAAAGKNATGASPLLSAGCFGVRIYTLAAANIRKLIRNVSYGCQTLPAITPKLQPSKVSKDECPLRKR
jgi:hypothetical protein